MDFAEIDLAALGGELGGVLYSSHILAYEYDPSGEVNCERDGELYTDQRKVRGFRGAPSFPIHEKLDVHIAHDRMEKGEGPCRACVFGASQRISQQVSTGGEKSPYEVPGGYAIALRWAKFTT